MSTKNRKNKKAILSTALRDDELSNSGVGKILLVENERLKDEVGILKKSLKVNQDELEKLRSKNHELDKQKSILDYKLNTAFLPEFLKFFSSSVGTGLAVNFFFNNQVNWAIISLAISTIIYSYILFLYKK